MEKGNFKVRCISNSSGNRSVYTVGKVYDVINGKLKTDNNVELPLNGKVNTFSDWQKESSSEWELVKDEQIIIIYRKDREVIANIKEGNKVIKSAKATCNPSDEFDFEVGAKLAFKRLMGEDEKVDKTGGNFKARCIKTSDSGLIVGKVYEIINGYSSFESGAKMPNFEQGGVSIFKNFGDMKKWFGVKKWSEFEEVAPQDKPKTIEDYTTEKLLTEIKRRMK